MRSPGARPTRAGSARSWVISSMRSTRRSTRRRPRSALRHRRREPTEHLDGVTSALGALERGVDEADVARLFRAVHTLKGAAYVVGCVRVGEVAHRMEDVLVVAREGRRPLTPPAVETLFAAEGAL